MSKIYKTAQGKTVDMDRLRLMHEHEPAVGNMSVNARGDEIDSQGNIIKPRNEIMRDHYKNKTIKPDN
jgi:hypothetical protein